MSERNAIKARTCTECDVHHVMTVNAFGLKLHAKNIRKERARLIAEESAIKSTEKVLRDSPQESPGGFAKSGGPDDERAADPRSPGGGKDEGIRAPSPQETS